MNWIKSSQFQFVQNPDRHYVFRRNNTGNTEIDVPKNITTKGRARMWLLAHPEAPTRYACMARSRYRVRRRRRNIHSRNAIYGIP